MAADAVGRLKCLAKDGLGKEDAPWTRVIQNGKEIAKEPASHPFDLPPGTYDVVFERIVESKREGVTVKAGKQTEVAADAVGRLKCLAKDGLGKEYAPWTSVLQNGKEIAKQAASHPFDLPPGIYDLVFDYDVDLKRKDVIVDAGRQTVVRVDDIGRLDITSEAPVLIYQNGETVAWVNRREQLNVPAGVYDLKFKREEGDLWQRGVSVSAGKQTAIRWPAR